MSRDRNGILELNSVLKAVISGLWPPFELTKLFQSPCTRIMHKFQSAGHTYGQKMQNCGLVIFLQIDGIQVGFFFKNDAEIRFRTQKLPNSVF